MNWLDVLCRVGTTMTAVAGTAATGAWLGSFGGPGGIDLGTAAGVGAGVSGGLAVSDDICKQAAYDMYMRQKCAALKNGEMAVKIKGIQMGTVKELADKNLMPVPYYEEIRACEEAGYLPKDAKGMVLP